MAGGQKLTLIWKQPSFLIAGGVGWGVGDCLPGPEQPLQIGGEGLSLALLITFLFQMTLYLTFPVAMFWIANQAEWFEDYVIQRKVGTGRVFKGSL